MLPDPLGTPPKPWVGEQPKYSSNIDKKQLQIEGSIRLEEVVLGRTPQKELRSRYEIGDHQGQ